MARAYKDGCAATAITASASHENRINHHKKIQNGK
jgi:hypothetical protein